MVSLESVLGQIAEAKGNLMVLLQDGTPEDRLFPEGGWADEMWAAYDHLTAAMTSIDRARLFV